MSKFYLYIVSDSVGETAEKVAIAAAEQFKQKEYEIVKFPYITEPEQVDEIVAAAKNHNSIVFFTTVIKNVRDAIVEKCEKNNILYNDIMEPLLNDLEILFNEKPILEPGIIHKLDEEYFNRVEAVEFAVKYDDGKDLKGIKKAEVVLLGISRTSKTPLSMYLAHKNVKVANIPLVPEVPVPDELYDINSNKIFGLINSPQKLNEIRKERIKALGLGEDAQYAKMDRIMDELEFAKKVYTKIGCKVINVANKAVEETANIIIESIKKNK